MQFIMSTRRVTRATSAVASGPSTELQPPPPPKRVRQSAYARSSKNNISNQGVGPNTNEVELDVPELSSAPSGQGHNLADILSAFAVVMNQQQPARSNLVGQRQVLSGDAIQEFNPNLSKRKTVTQWLDHVEQISAIHGWLDAAAIHFSSTKLRGSAKVWYDTLQVIPTTWAEW